MKINFITTFILICFFIQDTKVFSAEKELEKELKLKTEAKELEKDAIILAQNQQQGVTIDPIFLNQIKNGLNDIRSKNNLLENTHAYSPISIDSLAIKFRNEFYGENIPQMLIDLNSQFKSFIFSLKTNHDVDVTDIDKLTDEDLTCIQNKVHKKDKNKVITQSAILKFDTPVNIRNACQMYRNANIEEIESIELIDISKLSEHNNEPRNIISKLDTSKGNAWVFEIRYEERTYFINYNPTLLKVIDKKL